MTPLRKLALASLLLPALGWLALGLVPAPALPSAATSSRALFDSRAALMSLSIGANDTYRLPVALDEVSPSLIDATLKYEDQHFFLHPGVNPVSLLRAALSTAAAPQRPIGASTITMQVARLTLGLSTRTIPGKLRQMFWALVLERHYSKREILEAYLNRAPYGSNVEGIGAASLVYFRKLPRDIAEPEAVSLAVLPQNPSLRWRAAGLADLDTARSLLASRYEPAVIAKDFLSTPARIPFLAPHYFQRVNGMRPGQALFASTLDPDLQRDAEEVLKSTLASFAEYGVHNGTALVAELPDMKVRAYVGSAGYLDSSISGFVNGLAAKRSPGSLLKPFLYALALEQGKIIPETMLEDVPIRLASYRPENFERNFLGPISATDALVRSRNIPALELFRTLEAGSFYRFLGEAGVTELKDEDYYGIALVLGGLGTTPEEIAQLYGVLGNAGKFRPLQFLSTDAASAEVPLLSPEAAFLAVDMLSKNPPALGRFKQQRIPWKTGTSYGSRDAWAAGLVGNYVVVVWLGEFDGKPNPNLIGRDLAGPVFFSLVDRLQSRGIVASAAPPRAELRLKKVEVCALSGALPGPDCPHRKMSWFIPGVSPIDHCRIHRKVAVDVATGLRLCPGESGGEERTFEFWESTMQKLFVRAGLRRATPPPYEARCGITTAESDEVRIISPEEHVEYRLEPQRGLELELLASAPADAKELFWFVDDVLVERGQPSRSFQWKAKVGRFAFRAVDDRGRSSVVKVRILPQDGGDTTGM